MVKKVHGEVNLADIFAKHLPSREKVHQLMALFGCEYRERRAVSAPLLRPHGTDGREGGHSIDDEPLPNFAVDLDAAPHNINLLPHMHPTTDIDRLFPTIDAAPGVSNDDDFDADNVKNDVDRYPFVAIGDLVDTDADGAPDECDAACVALGMAADDDDDGDGVVDGSDAFPLDGNESVDTDGDGVGNNADNDDDGDGVEDSADAYPLDSCCS